VWHDVITFRHITASFPSEPNNGETSPTEASAEASPGARSGGSGISRTLTDRQVRVVRE
jgi:hypothetical protein